MLDFQHTVFTSELVTENLILCVHRCSPIYITYYGHQTNKNLTNGKWCRYFSLQFGIKININDITQNNRKELDNRLGFICFILYVIVLAQHLPSCFWCWCPNYAIVFSYSFSWFSFFPHLLIFHFFFDQFWNLVLVLVVVHKMILCLSFFMKSMLAGHASLSHCVKVARSYHFAACQKIRMHLKVMPLVIGLYII